MTKPDILLPRKMLPIVEEQLDEAFTVHRLYEADDRTAMLAQIGGRIRGVANGFVAMGNTLLADLPNAEIVASFGVGYDHINVADCLAAKVMVTHTPDVLNEEVADTALGLLLMTVRELGQAEQWLRAGAWTGKGPYPLTQATLQGRRMGIFGLGRIGKAIAKRAESFGLDIEYHGRTQQEGVDYPYHATLTGLAEACDTLMVVAPGGAATHHAVNADVLKALGPNGIVINVGRGSVIDEAALIEALETGTIYGAGLDVFEDEPNVPEALLALPRVTVLPHVGSASQATRNSMGQLVVDNLKSWFATGKALTPVPEMTRL
ncbi:lactate dehydrogenase-like 2-hydroxyacid dehydrogenase [Roseibium hamelinense]|uniref:Lactate dehydrogenase-like 2-hydroxyacid dehydrogenase n=1 Tax=Roseibium hamelinense TaxID=150831 RepID=A0A562T945_9HYPH|nr:2-hydroxyacid dehydrogenase [Roseibium hamelinense]MTI45495.1 2-hydroxyacid dehydrogenase [Roseibium hamelinense]TWI90131.1 lactate dehydrogenase-like 2-hydroxyacid dehydrogenase [Roseibium hamelinense]